MRWLRCKKRSDTRDDVDIRPVRDAISTHASLRKKRVFVNSPSSGIGLFYADSFTLTGKNGFFADWFKTVFMEFGPLGVSIPAARVLY